MTYYAEDEMNEGLSMEDVDNIWDKAVPKTSGEYENLPDGAYEAEITEARIEHSKNGRLQFVLVMVVTEGSESAGRQIYKYVGLDTEAGISILKDDQLTLRFGEVVKDKEGNALLELYKPSDFQLHTHELIGSIVKVSLKTKTANSGNQYQNCYINKLILAPDDPMEENIF